MGKYIYKITNLVNKKCYIGQSVNPKKRFESHCERRTMYVSLINSAIKKYGKENFSFEILEYAENYNEREKFWIKYYNSKVPNGYNIQDGGEDPPYYKGEDNSFAKITSETANKIKEQLSDWKIPIKEIVSNNDVTRDIVRHINCGEAWKDKSLSYPIRPSDLVVAEWKADQIINLLKTTTLTQKEIGKIYHMGRSAVTMINIGKNHRRDNIDYPIRK